ncbi:iron uptake transporter deferrochelatase/peroxidase subunit [Nocardioides sp. BP30]|uniref:iron uptake transporter deferrochelatase/peroxidase subunit n=1 Tax=Nocardioides sp. BP30 TaxID=3036374 RepID=UPI0024697B05|nr:iron uptake transporter deferrochelatase/peroxidase subunit [Nocardioides sp. BP30]WGL51160.1 iron uptake transporter deferrochelatase/peroxidase subunit [Nocardioides sp. BP30]
MTCPFSSQHDEALPESRAESPGLSRRGLMGGALGVAATAAVVATASGRAQAVDPSTAASGTAKAAAAYPFQGEHQQGILTPVQRHAAYVAFDVTAADRDELQAALRELTDQARFLTKGGIPADHGIGATPADDGILGPVVPADALTATVSVGASLFDDRFGLSALKPARLRRMDEFPNDSLDRSVCDGDLLLQLCADNVDTVTHALRQIMRSTRGALQVRWRKDGFMSPPRPSGTPRNLLGFKDGTANPSTADSALMDRLVWTKAGGDEPAWVAGGSYHVVRVIRMLVEFWDRVSLLEQQQMIGRDRVTGAPLTGTHEFDVPAYATDSTGDAIPFTAHIRLANPRNGKTDDQQMLRRSFNYDAGTDANGQLDMGLIFTAFNADLDRQFVTVQKRLVDEPLVDYIAPYGGGYYFALPGVRDSGDWLGRGLFA